MKKSNAQYVAERRRKVKRILVALLGGKCNRCGYSKCIRALCFHHKGNKKYGIGDGATPALDKLIAEVDSCELVCANCHAEIHAGL